MKRGLYVLLFGLLGVQGCVFLSEQSDRFSPLTGPLMVVNPQTIAVERYLQSISPHSFSGLVVIEQGGELILAQGYGYAQRNGHVEFDPESTLFPIGALREPMLSALALRHEEAGGWQLLDTLGIDTLSQTISPHALMAHLIEKDGDFAGYSTDSLFHKHYDMLTSAYTQSSGQKAEIALQDQFWDPFGMENTEYYLPESDMSRLALRQGTEVPASVQHQKDSLRFPLPVYSTASDLYRWQKAIENRQVVSAGQWQKWFSPYTSSDSLKIAYGWRIGLDSLQHPHSYITDTTDGYLIDYRWYPKEKLWVLVLGNRFDASTAALGEIIARMLLEPKYQPVPTPTREVQELRWPAGERGELLLELLALRGQPLDSDIQKFIAEHYSLEFVANYTPQEHTRYLRLLLSELQDAEPVRLQTDSDALQLLLEKAGIPYRLHLNFSQNNRIAQIRFNAGL